MGATVSVVRVRGFENVAAKPASQIACIPREWGAFLRIGVERRFDIVGIEMAGEGERIFCSFCHAHADMGACNACSIARQRSAPIAPRAR